VTVSGFKPEIDETPWLMKRATHTLGDGGFTTALELEVRDDPTKDRHRSHFRRPASPYKKPASLVAKTYIWLILESMNKINWSPKAAKQARKLDRPVRLQILDAVEGLATMPDVSNVKALINHEYGYRLRVGDYRVLFDWDGAIKIVDIQEVRKRDERTY
jgi:mRNA interferase RelE/StbE